MLKFNEKFSTKQITANGYNRAFVNFTRLKTLWFNTGTLCNLSCKGCYIESSPTNNNLLYLNIKDVKNYIDQMALNEISCDTIGITGGEPFMNRDIIEILDLCIKSKYSILVLTNAMQPMLNKIKDLKRFSDYNRLTFRVSLDHYNKNGHESIRGKNTWDKALEGIHWLIKNNFKINIASRIINKNENMMRVGFAKLFKDKNFKIDAYNKSALVLFPEMDLESDTPEITTECWGILNSNPKNLMCSDSRMIIKKREEVKTSIVSCTLIPYEKDFSYGNNLKDSFKKVYLNHPYCSKFCVLGGASCSNN
jgi:MoaA/NifB/PqqE/SkfB family radical SAM enzyme